MFLRLFEKFSNYRLSVFIAKGIGMLIPDIKRLKKYRNILITPYSIYYQASVIKNNPLFVQMAPTSVCNYRCLFCEIHKDNLLYPNRSKNMVDIGVIQNYESFLSTLYKLVFSGGTAEPLLNKDFGKIVEYLKSRYGTNMTVNTNASMLNSNLVDILINHRFDKILVSYHAGSKEGYRELMTGNVDRVDENLGYLKEQKKLLGKEKPEIQFNFALQKLNAKEYSFILKKANKLGASAVLVSKYYGGRNRLQDRKVSFDYDIEEGNRVLDELYSYAKKERVNLYPKRVQYWTKQIAVWDPENYNASKRCMFPWMHLHFKPVPNDIDCHYVGACNRIELFKIAYDKIQLRTQKQFSLLWNHPILQYLRKTVNEKKSINSICKYCKNFDRETLRNIDAQKYAEVRDKAMKDFFSEFREKYHFSEMDGIEILHENPHSDDRFADKMLEL